MASEGDGVSDLVGSVHRVAQQAQAWADLSWKEKARYSLSLFVSLSSAFLFLVLLMFVGSWKRPSRNVTECVGSGWSYKGTSLVLSSVSKWH